LDALEVLDIVGDQGEAVVDRCGTDKQVEIGEGLARTVEPRFLECEYIECFANWKNGHTK
jgi:hypothetical protein